MNQIPRWMKDLQKTGRHFRAAFGLNFEFRAPQFSGVSNAPISLRKGCVLVFSPQKQRGISHECSVTPFSLLNPRKTGTGVGGVYFKFPGPPALKDEEETKTDGGHEDSCTSNLPSSGTLYPAGLKRSLSTFLYLSSPDPPSAHPRPTPPPASSDGP